MEDQMIHKNKYKNLNAIRGLLTTKMQTQQQRSQVGQQKMKNSGARLSTMINYGDPENINMLLVAAVERPTVQEHRPPTTTPCSLQQGVALLRGSLSMV